MITREWCRVHKGKSRERLDQWLNRYANANFEAGIDFATSFISSVLKENSTVTDEDIKRLKCHSQDKGPVAKRYISPMDYKEPGSAVRSYDKFKFS